MPEHIHLFVSLDHRSIPAVYVGKIRDDITKRIIELFPVLEKALGKELFSRSFYAGIIGNVTGLELLAYINRQWGSEKSKRFFETKKYLSKQKVDLTQYI